ncbi:MAG: 23S rRNA (guanosine(2251)-2'-O)-methyltransferase RlmB [Candidatus Margulisbacteria bacterium]|nr:23S rRNA (guanosine(2251)-2'-O)-methyltransferase RlmB [Candidatus Margulisiibacteriota bacterium]
MHIVKGKRSVLEAVRSGVLVDRILILKSHGNKDYIKDIVREAETKRISIKYVASDVFKSHRILGQDQGVIAVLQPKKQMSLEDIIENKALYPVLVALDHLHDPFNFGSILRTCEVLGVKGIIYPKDRHVQLTPGVIKSSSGAIEHLDLVKVTNLSRVLSQLKKEGFWLYGADESSSQTILKHTFQYPCVLVFGNEEKGISHGVSKLLDMSVQIPIRGKVSSLNVSVAAGIMVYTVTNTPAYDDF